MNWRGIRAVVRKDLTVVLRAKAVLIPLILVPVILQVIMPAAFGIAATMIPTQSSDLQDLQQLITAMPPAIAQQTAGLNDQQLFLVLMLVYFFAPLYLIVPLMVSSVFAADSFAGEKERKTLEALIYTPLTDREIVLGKMLAAWIPAVIVAVGSFLAYSVVVNVTGWPLMGRIFFPNWMWIVLVFWVAPAASAVGLSATILVSARVRTFQEAYQLGGVVVLPIIMLMFGQIAGILFFSVPVTALLGFVLWIIAGALLWFAIRTLNRSEMIAQL